MKSEMLRLPTMEKKMDLLVVHLAQLLQDSGKAVGGSAAEESDRQKRALEEENRSEARSPQPRAPIFSSVPPTIGEHSGGHHEQQQQSTEPWNFAQKIGQDFRPPRMELPIFSGENPDGWVYRT